VNELFLIINNQKYSGWLDITLKRSIENLCGEFSVSITDRFTPAGKPFFVVEQDRVEIKIDNNKMLTGYVDRVAPSYGPSGTTIVIEGRDKTADLVDCSAVHDPGSFKNTTFENMVKILIRPFNISAIFPTDLPKEKFNLKISSGDSIFQLLDRLASKYGLLLQTNINGELIFMKNEFSRADTGLAIGDNIITIAPDYNVTDRFLNYIVRGQNATEGKGAWGKSQPQIVGRASDGGILRNRVLLLQAETNATAASCRARAQWEAAIRRARAVTAAAEVQGWYQTGSNKLWEINKIINVNAPQVYIENTDLLISSIEFKKSTAGTTTRLGLVPDDSYLREPFKEEAEGGKERWAL